MYYIFTSEPAWIGLHQRQPSLLADCMCQSCPDTEGPPSPECEVCVSCRGVDKWQWEDGTQYGWTNWHPSQPSDLSNEKCTRFHGDGKWFDGPRVTLYYFICKKGTVTDVISHTFRLQDIQ